jgi:circadian clock protein KaiB
LSLLPSDAEPVLLRLYVAGSDAPSGEARRLCQEVLERCRPLACRLEIVDVFDDPGQAERDRVLATPTLVRLEPPPLVRLIGGLRSAEFILDALQLAWPSWWSRPSERETQGVV